VAPAALSSTMTTVFESQTAVPSDSSGCSVGMRSAVILPEVIIARSDELTDLVFRDGGGDPLPIFGAARHRLGEMNRLLRGDFGWHRRLVLVNDSFNQSWAGDR
jgi:hypothetical protein